MCFVGAHIPYMVCDDKTINMATKTSYTDANFVAGVCEEGPKGRGRAIKK